MKASQFLARQKYRFDLGQGFLAIVNFAFVVIAASDKITSLVDVPAKILVPVLVPLALVLVWLLGAWLDRMQFAQAYCAEQNRRNEMLSAVHSAAINPAAVGEIAHQSPIATQGINSKRNVTVIS